MSHERDDAKSTSSSVRGSLSKNDSAFGLGAFPEDGAFMQGLHKTRPVLWLSVLLMFLGVGGLGASVVSLHYASSALGWSTFVGGVLLLMTGIGLAVRNRMGNDIT